MLIFKVYSRKIDYREKEQPLEFGSYRVWGGVKRYKVWDSKWGYDLEEFHNMPDFNIAPEFGNDYPKPEDKFVIKDVKQVVLDFEDGTKSIIRFQEHCAFVEDARTGKTVDRI